MAIAASLKTVCTDWSAESLALNDRHVQYVEHGLYDLRLHNATNFERIDAYKRAINVRGIDVNVNRESLADASSVNWQLGGALSGELEPQVGEKRLWNDNVGDERDEALHDELRARQ